MDPVSLALASTGVGLSALALFEPAIKACFELYGVYKLSSNFGLNFKRVRRNYELQVTRTAWMMTTETRLLVGGEAPNTLDAQAVQKALGGIQTSIETCEKLMAKHGEPSGPRYTRSKEAKFNSSAPRDDSETPERQLAESAQRVTNCPERDAESVGQSRLNHQVFGGAKKKGWLSRRFNKGRKQDSSTSSVRSEDLTGTSSAIMTSPATSTSQIPQNKLTTSAVRQAQEDFAREAETIQEQSKKRLKAAWIVEDKKVFEAAVGEITSLNDFLQNRLMIRFVTGQGMDAGLTRTRVDNIEESLLDSYKAKDLLWLHKALRSVNQGLKNRVGFSLPLQTQQSDSINQAWVNLSGKAMEAVTQKRVIYAQKPLDGEMMLVLLVAELNRTQKPSTEWPTITSLFDSLQPLLTEDAAPLQCLGRIISDLRETTLFQDVSERYRIDGGLVGLLQDESWRTQSYQLQHATLARRIAEVFLALGSALSADPPRISNLVFYAPGSSKGRQRADAEQDLENDQEDEESNEDHYSLAASRLSTLNITSNFGTLEIRTVNELMSTSQVKSSNTVLALGLILYQIGAWKHMSYTVTAVGLERARKNALDRLTDVDAYLAGRYAEVVGACLRWKEDNITPMATTKMLQNIVFALKDYETTIQHRF